MNDVNGLGNTFKLAAEIQFQNLNSIQIRINRHVSLNLFYVYNTALLFS